MRQGSTRRIACHALARRPGLRHPRRCGRLRRETEAQLIASTPKLERKSALTEESLNSSASARWPLADPQWELFQNNQSVWDAVMGHCEAARQSIRLEQYIFGTRGVGRQLLDVLSSKARQGVDVRVLADGLGSKGLARSDGGRELLRNGGHIALFNGVRDVLRNPVGRAHRLHRKTLILDDSRVMVGGSCYEDRMSTWRDTMICVEGPLPSAIGREFDRASGSARHRSTDAPCALAGTETTKGVWQYALSGPGIHGHPDLREELPRKLASAERSISLTTPYLVPNRRLWRALTCAAERGVRVQILMPARSDHRALDLIGRRFAHALVRRGVDVRGYEKGMLHAKVALVDGAWSSVSSSNLDVFSTNLNLESGVFSTSPALHAALSEQWEIDWADARRL